MSVDVGGSSLPPLSHAVNTMIRVVMRGNVGREDAIVFDPSHVVRTLVDDTLVPTLAIPTTVTAGV